MLSGALLLSAALVPPARGEKPLSSEEIAQRMLDRIEASYNNPIRTNYTFLKFIVTEEVDNKGKLREKKEKEVLMQNGRSSIQQIRINGRALSGVELRRQTELEAKARQQFAQTKTAKREETYEHYLTTEIVARYRLTQLSNAVINGRPAYVLAFAPRSGNLPVKTVVDRLINNIAGTAWIDQEEFELVKTDIRLQSEITLLGGLIGSLKQLHFTLERMRMEPGIWLQSVVAGDYEARKLLDLSRVKTRAESKDFKKISAGNLSISPARN